LNIVWNLWKENNVMVFVKASLKAIYFTASLSLTLYVSAILVLYLVRGFLHS